MATVAIHTHAVTNAVAEVFVVRPKTGIRDHLSRGCVDCLARQSGTRDPDRCGLGPMLHLEHIFHALRCLPHHECPREI